MDLSFRTNWVNLKAGELAEFLNKRQKGEMSFFLLDVRNPNEQEICSIPGTDLLIPVKELAENLNLLPPKEETIIVYCKSGVRSTTACKFLLEQGYTKLYHLQDGILAYAREVDPEMAEY